MAWYSYERLGEDGKLETISGDFYIDGDGSITGHIVMNVRAWFDENPDEWKARGWTKHIHPDMDLIFNRQTHYIITTVRQVDEYTIEDVYHALPKTEEMLALEELLDSIGGWYDSGVTDENNFGGFHFRGGVTT